MIRTEVEKKDNQIFIHNFDGERRVSGGIIGVGGVLVSFFFGAGCAMFILPILGIECSGLFDIKCLF